MSVCVDVRVDAYGGGAALSKVAAVSVRDGRSLLVTLFDGALAGAAERAIRGAGLGLNPGPDPAAPGRLLVPVPRPTAATREAMRKVRSRGVAIVTVRAFIVGRRCVRCGERFTWLTFVYVLCWYGQLALKEAEAARVSARHVRKSAMDSVKKAKADLPVDEVKRLEKEVQGLTDSAVKVIDKVAAEKVKAIDKP